jgi:phospholipid/cholesterol/gamma-HCH transport system substrate-binding protein
VAPPVVHGRAAAKQRLVGLVFLGVLVGLVALTVALYQKAFTPTVDVVLQADRAGNQLTKGADVKARGVLVGEVGEITSIDGGARVQLAIRRDKVGALPSDATAQLLPKTLFGEKFVALDFDSGSGARPLRDGDVIPQDRSETARELATALDNLLPLLQTLEPQQVSTTLNALSSALRGRGDRIGENLVLTRDYLAQINPELPVLAEDFRGLADFADTLDASADDLVRVLDNLSAVNRNLVESEDELSGFLAATTGVAGTARGFLAENEQRFITLARESVPNLTLYAEFSPQFPCLADGLVRSTDAISDTFGNLQPGLHITLEVTKDNGGYVPGDEPEYLDRSGPTCRGLVGPPEVPFPEYTDARDGYRDGQGVDERTGQRDGSPPTGPEGPYTYPDQRRQGPDGAARSGTSTSASATPFSPASYDKAAVGAVVAPAYGVPARDVPDVAVLLFGPVARGTVVSTA